MLITLLLYIDAMSAPLDGFTKTFKVVAEGVVEKVDPEKKVAIVKVVRFLKGTSSYTHLRLNVGAGPQWHPDAVMPHFVPGKKVALWWYWGEGPKGAVYVDRFFLEFWRNGDDPEKPWWFLNALATLYNRTYNGPVEELLPLLEGMLAGKVAAPRVEEKLPPISRDSLAALREGRMSPPFRKRSTADAARPRDPAPAAARAKGLRVELFEGRWTSLPDFGAMKGVASVRDVIGTDTRERDYGLRFSGFIEIPRPGVWTFTLVSNDGSALSVGGATVVDNDHHPGVVEASGEIALKAGAHALRLDYVQHSGFQVLELLWEGPGLARQPVPASAFTREAK